MIPSEIVTLLSDESVTDIWVNSPSRILFEDSTGIRRLEGVLWPLDQQRKWVLKILSECGKSWDARFPFSNAVLKDGHRLHVIFPPISTRTLYLSFRRAGHRLKPISKCSRWRETFRQNARFMLLQEFVRQGKTVIIGGATGSGKTTLMNDLAASIPNENRIIALEDTPELVPQHPHFLRLNSRCKNSDGYGEVTLRELLKQSLRMRPDRILLGECRGDEVLELLQVLNTGHRGTLATIHANDGRDILRRLELLCLLASGGRLSSSVIRDLIASGVQMIAHVERHHSTRTIGKIYEIAGRENDTILLRPVLEMESGCVSG